MVSKKKKTYSWFDRLLGKGDLYNDDYDSFEDSDDGTRGMYDDDERDVELDDDMFEDKRSARRSNQVIETADDLDINLVDKGNSLVAQALVPGLDENEIEVDLNREMLTILTKSNEHCVEKGGDYLYEELIFGSFSRSLLLPSEIEVEDSRATVKDGVLTVTMPKIDKASYKKISVKRK